MHFSIILILNFILITLTQEKLIQVIQFIRHGARAPIDYYGDVIEKYLPFKQSQLTNKGFKMAYDKGEQTRKNYKKFIQKLEKNPKKSIQLFSTEYQRTVFTSLAYLKGLFPNFNSRYIGLEDTEIKSFLKNPKLFTNLNKSLPNLNVQILSKHKQYLYHNKCLKFDVKKIKPKKEIYLDQKEFGKVISLKERFPKMFNQYCQENGKKSQNNNFTLCNDNIYRNYLFMKSIASTLESISFHKLEKIDEEILKIGFVSDLRYHYDNYNEYMTKQSGSNLFKYIDSFITNPTKCRIINNANNTSKDLLKIEFAKYKNKFNCKKYVLVSSHDDVLQNLIRNLFDFKKDVSKIFKNYKNQDLSQIIEKLRFYWPSYISDFTIEIHSNKNKKFVKVLFNGKEIKNLPLKKFKNKRRALYTSKGVEFKRFVKLIRERIDKTTKYDLKCEK